MYQPNFHTIPFLDAQNRLESADKNVINYVVGGCLEDCIHSLYTYVSLY